MTEEEEKAIVTKINLAIEEFCQSNIDPMPETQDGYDEFVVKTDSLSGEMARLIHRELIALQIKYKPV